MGALENQSSYPDEFGGVDPGIYWIWEAPLGPD